MSRLLIECDKCGELDCLCSAAEPRAERFTVDEIRASLEKERITEKQIEEFLKFPLSLSHGNNEYQAIIRQLQSDLSSQAQLTTEWKNFFKDMRRQRDRAETDLASVKAECLPWAKTIESFDRHRLISLTPEKKEEIKALIKKLEGK